MKKQNEGKKDSAAVGDNEMKEISEEILEMVQERKRAKYIIDKLQDGEILVYASDGYRVRTVNNLLSDSQIECIHRKIVEFLNDLVKDIDKELEYMRAWER